MERNDPHQTFSRDMQRNTTRAIIPAQRLRLRITPTKLKSRSSTRNMITPADNHLVAEAIGTIFSAL